MRWQFLVRRHMATGWRRSPMGEDSQTPMENNEEAINIALSPCLRYNIF